MEAKGMMAGISYSGNIAPGNRIFSHFHYISCLKAFGTFSNNEFNRVSFIERFITCAALYFRVMYEDVIARSSAYKPKTFFAAKPLYCSFFFHFSSFFTKNLQWQVDLCLLCSWQGFSRETPFLFRVKELGQALDYSGKIARCERTGPLLIMLESQSRRSQGLAHWRAQSEALIPMKKTPRISRISLVQIASNNRSLQFKHIFRPFLIRPIRAHFGPR
jgi:hypothetical protein